MFNGLGIPLRMSQTFVYCIYFVFVENNLLTIDKYL